MTQTGKYTINFSGQRAKDELNFGWKEWSGTKSASYPVHFATAFAHTPAVVLGLVGITNADQGMYFTADAANLTAAGFDIAVTVTPANGVQTLTFHWLATDA